MKRHVERPANQLAQDRKTLRITLDAEQVELLEKLSLFFSQEINQDFTKNRIIEEAVAKFVQETTDYISSEYALDIRRTALTDMRDYKQVCAVDIAALDTVVLPVRDSSACKDMLFNQRRWTPGHLNQKKLRGIKYAAFCFGAPTNAITHYARLRAFTSLPEDTQRQVLHFEDLEELGHRLEWKVPRESRLRYPRYTGFAMLLEAESIEELFDAQ